MIPDAVQKMADNADKLIADQAKEKGNENVSLDIDPELLKANEDKGKQDDLPNLDHINNMHKPDDHAKIIKKAPAIDETNKEIAALERLVRSLENDNKTLRINMNAPSKEIENLKAEIVSLKSVIGLHGKTKVPEQISGKFSTEDRKVFEDEGYSDQMINILEKNSAQPIAPPVDDTKLQNLTNRLDTAEKTTAQTAQQLFEKDLDIACPNWRVINKNPEFEQSLDVKAPYSQRTKLEILGDAYRNQDVSVVSTLFNEFKGAQPQVDNNPKLDDIAIPPSSNGQPPKTQVSSERWGPAQIKKFYDSVQRNPSLYTPEEFAAIEKAKIHPPQ